MRALPLVTGFCAFCAIYLATGDAPRPAFARTLRLFGRLFADISHRVGMKAQNKGAMRRQTMREMPALLDIVTLGLSAGLSFDASLELYCARYDTALAHAMQSALTSWRLGVSTRGEALADLSRELDVSSLRSFAAAVDEALSFGSPLAEVLTRQAQTIREEQRAEIEEEIERAPVKMLIPLCLLTVPAMLISILGPLLAPALGTG